jgi:hypothetical protein
MFILLDKKQACCPRLFQKIKLLSMVPILPSAPVRRMPYTAQKVKSWDPPMTIGIIFFN